MFLKLPHYPTRLVNIFRVVQENTEGKLIIYREINFPSCYSHIVLGDELFK